MNSFFRKLNWFLQRRRKEAELREELQFHLDEEAEERKERGSTSEQAKRAAHRDLGNITLLQENIRAVWIAPPRSRTGTVSSRRGTDPPGVPAPVSEASAGNW